jgi:hypothetical protein
MTLDYSLCKRLKDAGFPQECEHTAYPDYPNDMTTVICAPGHLAPAEIVIDGIKYKLTPVEDE